MSKCKFYKQIQYYSDDSGTTWFPTGLSRKGDLIEVGSADCGDVPPTIDGKCMLKYTDGSTWYKPCDSSSALTSMETKAYKPYSAMTQAVIGGCVTTIGTNAFYQCTSLSSVTIPNSVTGIGEYAFSNCSSLTSVNIPDSVTRIFDLAFEYCYSLTSVTIGSGVTSIGDGTFIDSSGLTSVTCLAATPPIIDSPDGSFLPDTDNLIIYVPCASVDTYNVAFGWSSYASRIQGIPPCGEPEPFYGKYKFYYGLNERVQDNCGSSSVISSADTKTGLYPSSSMTKAVIGECPDGISDKAFSGFTSLREVEIGSHVESIGNGAFYQCTGLTSVDIPNSVTTIGRYAFSSCHGLTSVTIGSGVTSIDDEAFWGCVDLQNITCLATTPPSLGGLVFDQTGDSPIYVPLRSLTAYKNAWGHYASRIQAIPNS